MPKSKRPDTAALFRAFKFYKRITDDANFSKYFLDWLFDRFRSGVKPPPG